MLRCLASILVITAAPRVAHACVCAGEVNDMHAALANAKKMAVAIYRARAEALSEPWDADLEVLEVFKGEMKIGQHLKIVARSDCSFPFRAGEEYLVYAHCRPVTQSATPGSRSSARRCSYDAVSKCSRTKAIAPGDAELDWLRTGRWPPMPVALQRESVSCKECDALAIAEQVTGLSRDSMSSPQQSRAAAKFARPFFTLSGLISALPNIVLVGVSQDRTPFELTTTPSWSLDAVCMLRVELRWCKRLDVLESDNFWRCVDPSEPIIKCDERQSRKAAWDRPEQFHQDACNWYAPSDPGCFLGLQRPVLPENAPQYPLLKCRPDSGDTDPKGYSCHVETAPPSRR